MNLELSFVLASFGVHLVLEVGQEFLERINRGTESDVGDDQGSFENGFFVGLLTHFMDTAIDEHGNLAAHDFRHFGSFLVKDIGSFLLLLLPISAHIEEEVLEDKELKESTLLPIQMCPRSSRLVEHNVRQ